MSTYDDLIKQFNLVTPVDLRPDNSDEGSALLIGYFKIAARLINTKVGRTTEQTFNLTLLDGHNEYDLPDGWRRVTAIIPRIDYPKTVSLGVPIIQDPPFGFLPNGQEVTPGMDLINRQQRAMVDRKITDGWRIFQGKLLIEFQFTAGMVLRVEGRVVNDNIDDVPPEYLDYVVTYARYRAAETAIQKLAGTGAIDADHVAQRALSNLTQMRNTFLAAWRDAEAGIEGEV